MAARYVLIHQWKFTVAQPGRVENGYWSPIAGRENSAPEDHLSSMGTVPYQS